MRYQIRPDVVPLLFKLAAPITKEDAIAAAHAQTGADVAALGELFDRVRAAGLLREESDAATQSTTYQMNYSRGVLSHHIMLQDFSRTDSFKRALEEVVKPGDVVVDVGAGSGILGFFASRAGAGKVHLVEQTAVIEDAKAFAKRNDIKNLEFHHVDAADFDIPQKANVIVSEWIGFFLHEEYMFKAFTDVRDKVLADGGVVVPSAAKLYLAPIEDSRLYASLDGFGFWEVPQYGLDLSPALEIRRRHLRYQKAYTVPSAILSDPQEIHHLDCVKDYVGAAHFERKLAFTVQRAGSLHGFIGYFDLFLSPNVIMGTSPHVQPTHWAQTYFPIQAIALEKGDVLEVSITTTAGAVGPKVALDIAAPGRSGPQRAHYEYESARTL